MFKLEFNDNKSDDGEYEIKTIQDNVVYTRELKIESYLPSLYHLVL